MIRDAPVLILDEPTTSLDAVSTHRAIEPMRRLMEDRTAVVISHDLSIAREADRVLVLREGRLSETGTPGYILPGTTSNVREL